jgi:hypothetical protein
MLLNRSNAMLYRQVSCFGKTLQCSTSDFNEHSTRDRLPLNLLLVCTIKHTVKNSASLNHWDHFAISNRGKGDI